MKFYKTNLKIWWTNSGESFPENHIENFYYVNWEEMSNSKISYNFGGHVLSLIGTEAPNYIKVFNDKQSLYFLNTGVKNIVAIDLDGNNQYQYVYELDMYMSVYYDYLQILKQQNPSVRHIRGFRNRFIYHYNEDKTLINTIEFNNITQKYLGNTVMDKQPSLIRNKDFESYLTNNDIIDINYSDVSDDTFSFNPYYGSHNPIVVNRDKLNTPNSKGRFSYLIAKSSAKMDTTQVSTSSFRVISKTYSQETKIIIPITDLGTGDIMRTLLNIDITKAQTMVIDPFGDNFIGFFESEIPFLAYACESIKNPNEVKLEYGSIQTYEGGTNVYNVPFFEVPLNYSLKIKLNTLNDRVGVKDAINKKLSHIVNNLNSLLPETEPLMVNPMFFYEKYSTYNGNEIILDTSYITFNQHFIDTVEGFITINANILLDSSETISYNFDNFNNLYNTNWNNLESNKITETNTSSGVFGSASANYYTNNISTIRTAIQNRKSQEAQSWMDFGFKTANKAVDYLSDTLSNAGDAVGDLIEGNIGGVISSIGSQMKDTVHFALNIAQNISDNKYQQERANRSLASKIKNIISSPASTLSNPFIGGAIKNPNNGKFSKLFLFNSFELNEYDKNIIFSDYLKNGYWIDNIEPFNNYFNRLYMNVLCIDTSFNNDILVNILLSNYSGVYDSLIYVNLFLLWVGSVKRFYQSETLINVLDWKKDDYIDNIENDLLPFSNIIDITTNIDIIFENIQHLPFGDIHSQTSIKNNILDCVGMFHQSSSHYGFEEIDNFISSQSINIHILDEFHIFYGDENNYIQIDGDKVGGIDVLINIDDFTTTSLSFDYSKSNCVIDGVQYNFNAGYVIEDILQQSTPNVVNFGFNTFVLKDAAHGEKKVELNNRSIYDDNYLRMNRGNSNHEWDFSIKPENQENFNTIFPSAHYDIATDTHVRVDLNNINACYLRYVPLKPTHFDNVEIYKDNGPTKRFMVQSNPYGSKIDAFGDFNVKIDAVILSTFDGSEIKMICWENMTFNTIT